MTFRQRVYVSNEGVLTAQYDPKKDKPFKLVAYSDAEKVAAEFDMDAEQMADLFDFIYTIHQGD